MEFHKPHMPHMHIPHIPHPHLERRKEMFEKAREEANGFNSKLAVNITNIVGTMWCAYAFAALALISFPAALHAGTATLVAWFAQTFLQLVLLSIIMVGQKVAASSSSRPTWTPRRCFRSTTTCTSWSSRTSRSLSR